MEICFAWSGGFELLFNPFYDCFMKFLEPLVGGLIELRYFLINEAVLTKMNLLDAPHPTDMIMPIASIVSGNHMRGTGRHDPSEQ